MKLLLAPSILSFPITELGTALPIMEKSEVDWIHLDIMDGQFVPPITFGDAIVRDLRRHCQVAFEAHLMTYTPEAHFDAFIAAGCQRIVFHAEATQHAFRHLQRLRELGVQAGIAINPGTPVSIVEPVLGVCDLVLVMTVNPGWGGQALIPATLDKVRAVRALAPDIHIQVDGGIDSCTLPAAIEAGANVFVVGNFLAKAPDLSIRIAELKSLLK
jgi:ribulose-phosphate 3-epimerase